MSQHTNNFKIGLFTLVGIGLLVAGILAFGTWSSFEKKSLFETYVTSDVSGLTVGSAVEFRGVRVGKVTRIGLSWNEYRDTQPGCVVVEFEMRDSAFVTPMGTDWRDQLQQAIDRGLRARIKAQGVTGTCIVSLEYLNPKEIPVMKFAWTPKYPVIPAAPGVFGELISSLQSVLRHVDRVDFSDINDLAKKDLTSAGEVLDHAKELDFKSISTNATALLQELRGSNARLRTFIDDTDDKVKKLQLQKVVDDADVLIKQLQDTVAKLEPGLTRIDFDSVNQTLLKARQALQNLDEVLSELKDYPPGFIFGQPPAKLKEVQPPSK